MKEINNPFINKIKAISHERWSYPDHPEAEPRFQVLLFAKDVAVFIFLPVISILMFKACDGSSINIQPQKKKTVRQQKHGEYQHSKSQIIDFTNKVVSKSKFKGIKRSSPGTLVKVKLLNKVETFANAPVHVRVLDSSLGKNLKGATLLGEASSNSSYNKVMINFNMVRHPNRYDFAVPINARALSLTGTLGLNGVKKEGFFARAALGASQNLFKKGQGADSRNDNLKDALLLAFFSGLMKESNSETTVEHNRANILVVEPDEIFYAELTDFFPEDK